MLNVENVFGDKRASLERVRRVCDHNKCRYKYFQGSVVYSCRRLGLNNDDGRGKFV
jgi:hypothetical protein